MRSLSFVLGLRMNNRLLYYPWPWQARTYTHARTRVHEALKSPVSAAFLFFSRKEQRQPEVHPDISTLAQGRADGDQLNRVLCLLIRPATPSFIWNFPNPSTTVSSISAPLSVKSFTWMAVGPLGESPHQPILRGQDEAPVLINVCVPEHT